ncbi:SEC14-like protein 4 [Folsomia candida]|uniref:CRAL-TRIO domain-containing protein n=1 Tax=Folsomia candida TaxID=158441 RepID=A0A226D5D0_FOLCA|nr:SEC14-like protein 4 [Folsomia candida]OXA40429.1 hypothetical protein Fcan01_24637 [Folsomia candida]
MEVFTDAELAALEQFRPRVVDVLPDEYARKDENLIRWLRARDLDLDKAEDLVKKSMQWRQDNKIDTIIESGIDSEMQKLFPFYIDAIDREGRVALTCPIGEWDVRESVEKDGPEKFIRYSRQLLETVSRRVRAVHEESGSNLPKGIRYTMICDYEGFGLRQLANMKSVNTILQIVGSYEAHYPETLNTALIINAPAVFSVLFNLMKPLMTARTINKIQIYSSDRAKWEPEVLKLVDASQIRPRFGGCKP